MDENNRVFGLKGPEFWNEDTLSDRQKNEMARIMFDVNADDERYLRVHPEVEQIISAVAMLVYCDRP